MTTAKQEMTPRQMRIAHWAYELERLNNYCVVDFETTDVNGVIIDGAILGPDGTVLLDQLIKPTERISEGAMAVHHISEAMVADAPSFLQVWPQIYEELKPFRYIITYNADFDARILLNTTKAAGLRVHLNWKKMFVDHDTQFVVPGIWQCLMEHYSELYAQPSQYGRGSKWQKLHEACHQMGVVHRDWHRALGDCQAAWKLLSAMAAQYVALQGEEQGEL